MFKLVCSIEVKFGGCWLAGCPPVSPRTCMRNSCVLCTFSPGMQHQPLAFPTPENSQTDNSQTDNSQTSTAAGRICADNFSCSLPHDRASPACTALQPPCPVFCPPRALLPCQVFPCNSPSHSCQSPTGANLSQKLHLQWEQMPHQAFTYKKETDFVSSFSFETQFLSLSCSSTFSHTRALSADEISDISSDTFWISINKKG